MIKHEHREMWINWLASEKRRGQNTVDAYRRDLDDFATFFEEQNSEQDSLITRQIFHGWLAKMASRKLARATISRKVSSLRSFLRFCSKNELLNIPDLGWLRAPKPQHTIPKSLSVSDTKLLLNAISDQSGQDWSKKRNFAVLMLLYGCGLRISEALSLQRKDAPLGEWLSLSGKGGKMRDVPILSATRLAIDDYLTHCPYDQEGESPLFLSNRGNKFGPRAVQRLIETLRVKLNLPEYVTPHALRHAFATHLLEI